VLRLYTCFLWAWLCSRFKNHVCIHMGKSWEMATYWFCTKIFSLYT